MSATNVLCAACLLATGASLAQATLIAYEPFDYPTGSGPGAGGIGFMPGGWTNVQGITVVSPDVSPPGSLPASGNALQATPTGFLTTSRFLSAPLSIVGDTWVSVIHQRSVFASIPEWLFVGSVGIGSGLNGTYSLGGASSTINLDSSVSYLGRGPDLLVAHLHFVGSVAHGELYLNPVNGPINPIASGMLAQNWAGAQIQVGSQFFSGATGMFDEIRIGTTFEDVAVPATPTGFALALAGAAILRRRRPGA